jgi:hypothetical protein
LTVDSPTNWAKVEGKVTTLGYCGSQPAPLAKATVLIEGAKGQTWTVTTNLSGSYQLWLNKAHSPLNLTVSYPSYAQKQVKGLNLAPKGVTTQNFELPWLAPCLQKSANSLQTNVLVGKSTNLSLQLANRGTVAATIELQKWGNRFLPSDNWSLAATSKIKVAIYNHPNTNDISYFNGDNGNTWQAYRNVLQGDSKKRFEVTVIADLSSQTLAPFETLILPDNAVPDSDLATVAAWFTTKKRILAVGSAVCYAAYTGFLWPASLGQNGAESYWSYGYVEDKNNQEVLLSDPFTDGYQVGDLLSNSKGMTQLFAKKLPPDARRLTSKQRDHQQIYAAARDVPGKGTIIFLGPYNFSVIPQDLSLLIRNSASGQGLDVPWLSAQLTTNTLKPGQTTEVAFTLDASDKEAMLPGDYAATIALVSNDPFKSRQTFPLTMTVKPLSTWGRLEGTVEDMGYCDTDPTPLTDALVIVEGKGKSWQLKTDENGAYKLWVDEAYNPLKVTVIISGEKRTKFALATQIFTSTKIVAQQVTKQEVKFFWPPHVCTKVSPPQIQFSVPLNTKDQTFPLTLTNDGALTTTFELREVYDSTADQTNASLPLKESKVTVVQEPKEETNESAGSASSSQAVTTDAFGYIFKDSQDSPGPIYHWFEIAPPAGGTGQEIKGLNKVDDGYAWPLPLPFEFKFYDKTYTSLALSTNGVLYFEDAYFGYKNLSIPSRNKYEVETFIAPYWDDLGSNSGGIYYKAFDSMVIIEYYHTKTASMSNKEFSLQVILFANGNILFQYQTSPGSDSATIGLQGSEKVGLEYSYNKSGLKDNKAICFAYPGQEAKCLQEVPWLKTSQQKGTLAPHTVLLLQVNLATAKLPAGSYAAQLLVLSEDKLNPELQVPLAFQIVKPIYLPFIRR